MVKIIVDESAKKSPFLHDAHAEEVLCETVKIMCSAFGVNLTKALFMRYIDNVSGEEISEKYRAAHEACLNAYRVVYEA